MLPISGFTIKLRQSNDYLKSAVLLYGLATFLILRSSLPWLMILPACIILSVVLIRIVHNQLPLREEYQLFYKGVFWYLQKAGAEPHPYERLTFNFDGGIFFAIQLYGFSQTRQLVIFNDQITQKEYRMLRVYERKAQ